MSGSFVALEAVIRQDEQLLARCLLCRGNYIVGQAGKNEIVVDTDSISSKHARLTVASEEHFALEDLGSANGTFVDGRRIDAVTPITLESTIMLGQARLTLRRVGRPALIERAL